MYETLIYYYYYYSYYPCYPFKYTSSVLFYFIPIIIFEILIEFQTYFFSPILFYFIYYTPTYVFHLELSLSDFCILLPLPISVYLSYILIHLGNARSAFNT